MRWETVVACLPFGFRKNSVFVMRLVLKGALRSLCERFKWHMLSTVNILKKSHFAEEAKIRETSQSESNATESCLGLILWQPATMHARFREHFIAQR